MEQSKPIHSILQWWRKEDKVNKRGNFNIDLYIKVLKAKGIDV